MKATKRIERKTVPQAYWIEIARTDERDMGPYRLCTDGGQRFGLSTLDAIRAQKEGVPFRGVMGDEPEPDYPNCDDPGAHRPGCKCNGGEPRF